MTEVDQKLLAGVLALLVLPMVGFWALSLAGFRDFALVAVAFPLLVITVVGLHLGRKVGKEADDPEAVDARLAESLGLSKEEFDERVE
ncbi:hypothetical protein [Natronomonas sp. EA1]|uniref:hypothetical protein n=1 Tax=Natronomonas sp. EA1 TaxID=3421655 RepID=UPI003EB790B8